MIIQGTSISVTYERIDNIKKVYYTKEEILKSFFSEATVLPIPDNAPAEVPRIIIQTLHEHAQLSISPTVATFEVKYDNGFEKDWSSCAKYIEERMTKVYEFLNILTNNRYKYTGIVSKILYDEIQQSGMQKMALTLLKTDNIRDIHDLNIKYTFVENNRFFVNVMLQNARMFKEGIKLDEAGALNEKNQVSESIGAIVDINDRYEFNCIANYHSDSTVLKGLIECMNDVIYSRLASLIEKGEY